MPFKILDIFKANLDKPSIEKIINENKKEINYVFGRTKQTPLILAIEDGRTEIIELLLKNNADTDYSCPFTGENAIHEAVRLGDLPIMTILLNHINDIDETDNQGITGLHLAVKEGHFSIIEILIERGSRVNEKDSWKWTSLHWAALNGDKKVIELLLARGADINAVTNEGLSPLHIAAGEGNYLAMELLLNKGAYINIVDNSNSTPLQYVVSNPGDDYQLVEKMIIRGANINTQDINGDSALHIAINCWNFEITRILLKYNANIDMQNLEGNTALHISVDMLWYEISKLLILYRAKTDIKNYDDLTPREYADNIGNQSMIDIFNSLRRKN